MRVIAIMPAYNAAKTIKKTVNDIPPHTVDKIIVVDDASSDDTSRIARDLGLEVVTHPRNRGYGGNQKTCYTIALSEGADIVVMIHPDYQYDSSLTGKMIEPIKEKRFDIMFGSRIRTRKEALAGGMPLYKYMSNRFLTMAENIVLGQNLSEYHTGFRAYSRSILKQLPFHKYSDDFIFDQQIILGAIALGARIGETPVPVRYFPEASSINFFRSSVYGLSIIRDLGLYTLTAGRHFT
jgi:glycosyltransferase involved in cell wall biosynthesis